jgi:hypothetical protein
VSQAIESTPMPFARFTNDFEERLSDGSLYIDVGISAQREVWCEISARLYDREEPTHVASWTGPIKTGKTTVALEFFGKVFHDMGFHEGRLQMRELRGKCHNVAFPIDLLTRIPEGEDEVANMVEARAAAARPTDGALGEPDLMEMESIPVAYTTRIKYSSADFSKAVWDSPEKRDRRAMLEKVQASRTESARAAQAL